VRFAHHYAAIWQIYLECTDFSRIVSVLVYKILLILLLLMSSKELFKKLLIIVFYVRKFFIKKLKNNSSCCMNAVLSLTFTVNSGEYIQAVCDRNLAENISRVLYPNDNVRTVLEYLSV